jgi:phospholipid-translocating ATPase
MIDGLYQSVIVYYVPYLIFYTARPVTDSGLDVMDRMRFGVYVAHPAIFAINMYIMINTYQWDWILLLVVCISDLFIFVFTGIFTAIPGASGYLYGAAAEVYGEATFWANFFIVPIICLFPRFAIKSIQKVYFPYDVDIIREQERMGMFDYLKPNKDQKEPNDAKSAQSDSSEEAMRKVNHASYASIDEDQRPIYPPSTTTRYTSHTHQHSQNNSNSTNYSLPAGRMSLEVPDAHGRQPAAGRPSVDRARPSYDRIRASMDRVRPSYEASEDFTSAARLSRIESSQSAISRFKPRLRGLSLSKSANN